MLKVVQDLNKELKIIDIEIYEVKFISTSYIYAKDVPGDLKATEVDKFYCYIMYSQEINGKKNYNMSSIPVMDAPFKLYEAPYSKTKTLGNKFNLFCPFIDEKTFNTYVKEKYITRNHLNDDAVRIMKKNTEDVGNRLLSNIKFLELFIENSNLSDSDKKMFRVLKYNIKKYKKLKKLKDLKA